MKITFIIQIQCVRKTSEKQHESTCETKIQNDMIASLTCLKLFVLMRASLYGVF